MRVFLTGGTGLVGRQVVAGLLQRGASVRALTRRPEQARAADSRAEWIGGDLLEGDAVAGRLDGSDVVIHCAGAMPATAEENDAINRDGTQRLLDEAVRARVPRFVSVSSTSVYGDADHDLVTEEHAGDGSGPYAASKRAAETLVLAAIDDGALTGAVVRPCMITGAGDGNLAPALAALVGQPVVPRPGCCAKRLDLVDAADVAWVLMRLAVDGVGGPGPYNVTGGDPLPLADILAIAAAATGRAPEWWDLSLEEARTALRSAAERGEPPPLPPELLGIASFERTYSIARARDELGYAPARSVRDVLRDVLTGASTP